MKLHSIILTLVFAARLAAAESLISAADRDDLAAVRALLASGSDPTVPNRYGVAPLTLACRNGNSEMVALLLKAGATPEPSDSEPALITASRTGSAECVRILLEAGANPAALGGGRQTALMWASAGGHREIVSQLLAAKADPSVTLASGFDALFFAVRAGHRDVVRILLASGVPVNDARTPAKTNPSSIRPGTSALMLAVENGHLELALELIAAGADPNDQHSGFTPLHAITWVRRTVRGDGADGIPPPRGSGSVVTLDFVRKIIAAGADVNARLEKGKGGAGQVNSKGATPFLFACQTGDMALMKLLLELGADPKIANADDCTPLLAATGMGVPAPGEEPASEEESIAAAKLLLELGADINHVDKNGETVMHCAAYKSAPELIRYLDTAGANINRWNKPNKHRWTPLLIAQGFRPGNFRPILYTIEAVSEVMRKHGVEPTPSPPPPGN